MEQKTESPNNIRIISMASHQSPIFKPDFNNKKWVLNGKKNGGYTYVIDRYKYSPTNSTIIDSYASYIYGKGLTSKYTAEAAGQWASVISIIPKDELRKVSQDYALFEEATIEILLGKSGNKIAEINHLPNEKVVPNEVDENGDITGYWYCFDWSDVQKNKPEFIPAFELGTKEKRTIFKIKKYSINEFYFSRPSYYSGLNYAELEEEISNYCINHIKNGLSVGHIININEGITDSTVKDEYAKNIEQKWTGTNNTNKFVLSFNSNKDSASTIESIQVSDAHKQYEFLTEEARKQLMVAHKITSPILFGIKDATGFGNNADEMQVAFDELMLNVITPKQEVILDALMSVLKQNEITIELEFLPLRKTANALEGDNQSSYNGAQIASAIDVIAKVKEGILTKEQATVFLIQFLQLPQEVANAMFTNQTAPLQELSVKCSAHSHESDNKIAQSLIELGEDEDLTEWDLVAIGEVDYTEDVKMASTGQSFPNAKSEQDSDVYKVRYQYAPLSVSDNSREFCRKMVEAGKIYRKEDIIRMDEQVVNAGWGAHGADKYSIWLYKGGGACHHKWFRKIYVKKGSNVDINSPLAELISTTNARKNGFNPHPNDDLVAIAPKDMKNNGFLEPR